MIYLDNAAATPIDPRVSEAMMPYLTEKFENPSANFYATSRSIRHDIESARDTVAQLLNAHSDEIIFTSGGTESCNLAILGYCRANRTQLKNHIITTKIEHHAVLNCFEYLEKHEGFDVTYLDCDEFGTIMPEALEKAVKPSTIFCSIIYAHNEIGTIQDIQTLSKICKNHDICFHTDACQAGSLPLDTEALKVGLLTLNGSKIYGPKGSGILYKKRPLNLSPLFHGGGQEFSIRPGTENTAGIIGFAKALELIISERENNNRHLAQLRDTLLTQLLQAVPEARLLGHPTMRIPSNINLLIPNIQIDSLLLKLDEAGICASAGSACASSQNGLSHVALALGVEDRPNTSTLRLTPGKYTTEEDIRYTAERLPDIIANIRVLSF